VLAAGAGIEPERAPRRGREIGVETAGDPVLDDIDRSAHRVRGHRYAAGHGLEIHEAECIGTARKHHDVGRRQMHRQILAETVAEERGMRMLLLEPCPLRTVADDDLAAAPRHVQECADILLDRYPSDIGGDGARHREQCHRMGLEDPGIDAAPPGRQVAESARGKIAAYRGGAHHAACGRAVEPAQCPIGQADRDRKAGAHVLRKLSVIRARKAHAGLQAEAPGAQPQGAFGRNVQSLRRERENAAFHLGVRQQRQTDFRVRRTGDAVEIPGGEHPHLVTEAPEPCRGLREGADHAVGLGKPRVRNDHDSHTPRQSHPAMTKR